jgi:hypothetical protein
MELVNWIKDNWKDVLDIVAYIVFTARLIVVLTPTLKDDNILLPIIKILGKLGLDKYGPVQR